MKITSLVIAAALIGGAVYVILFTDLLKRGVDIAQGYSEAATPQEALEGFHKAITSRQFATAAKYYVTREYGEQLKRAHDAARAMGRALDGINEPMMSRGYNDDRAVAALYRLDPFPTNFKVKDTPREKGAKAIGYFIIEKRTGADANIAAEEQMWGWPNHVTTQPLVPWFMVRKPSGETIPVELVKEGNAWKLDIKLYPGQADLITDYIAKHKAYANALDNVRSYMTNYATKLDFWGGLEKAIRESK